MPRWPALMFYTKDWQANANLKRCTFEQRGAWIEVLCLLHQQETEYGVLRWPLVEIAKAVGCNLATLQELVRKNVLKGADEGEACAPFTFTPTHGGKDGPTVILIPVQPGPIWYSSRMVRDRHIREQRAKNSKEAGHDGAVGL